MRRALALLTVLLACTSAHAACFDFTKPIDKVLKAPTALAPGKTDKAVSGIVEASGTDNAGVSWAEVRGKSPVPVSRIVWEMKSQVVRKGGGKDSGMTITPLTDPNFMAREQIEFVIKPFPLISVKWVEDWTFNLVQGTRDKPEKVIVAYEKVTGSSHVEHLCGSMVLTRDGDGTDVSIYEEIKATRRSESDNLNGIRATLRNLQGLSN